MKNYYQILGVNSSATAEELRRAYRILARRYHPDVNPGRASEEKFKAIAEAYETLCDPEKRRKFDFELERADQESVNPRIRAYQTNQGKGSGVRDRFYTSKTENFGRAAAQPENKPPEQVIKEAPPKAVGVKDVFRILSNLKDTVKGAWQDATRSEKKAEPRPQKRAASISKLSIIEVSCTMHDAISGAKKAVEISEPEGLRKVSVNIPAGVKTGSVLRLRAKEGATEELVVIIRVASHPFLTLQNKGLVAEVPISVSEAILGANITLPTLEEPVVVKVPPGSQSGTELRLKGKGVHFKDGQRGDLFYRFLVKVPETADAYALKEKAQTLDPYYAGAIRQGFPKNLLDA